MPADPVVAPDASQMRRARVHAALRAIEEGTRLDDLTDEEIDTIIDAARDHRTPAPAGDVRVVPVEPTPEMLEAGKGVVAEYDSYSGYEPIAGEAWSAMLAAFPTRDSSAVSGFAEGLREAVIRIARDAHVIGWQAGVGGMETAGAIVSYLAAHQEKIELYFAGKESPIDWPNFTNGGCLTWHAAESGRIVHPSEARAALTEGQQS